MQGQAIPAPQNVPPGAGSLQAPSLLDTPLGSAGSSSGSSQAKGPANGPENSPANSPAPNPPDSPPDSPEPALIIPYLPLNRWAPRGVSFSKYSACFVFHLPTKEWWIGALNFEVHEECVFLGSTTPRIAPQTTQIIASAIGALHQQK